MTEKEHENVEYCTYATCKVDDEMLPLAKAAAALSHPKISVQEYISNLINQEATKALGKKPVKRRRPPPHRFRSK